MPDLPVVYIFGVDNLDLKSEASVPDFETNNLDCRCYPTDDGAMSLFAETRPSAIISVGRVQDFTNLAKAPFSVRSRWIHKDNVRDLEKLGNNAFECFLDGALRKQNEEPLVSVFTPTYKTGDKIYKPFFSLMAQTYTNWEWVVVDDSGDDDDTINYLDEFASQDCRIRVYKNRKTSGSIGEVKRTACDLARGEILIELDHDDHLLPDAIRRVASGFQRYPDVGFIYTDFAESFEGGGRVAYGEGWGFGYGSYREETHNGVSYLVVNSPNINAKTIRHIVAAPNHIRSWRKSVYDAIGGHNPALHVVDDYELMVRTFLHTRMGRVPSLCYVQYRNETGNTHQRRNAEIQRLVRYISVGYDRDIHARFLELQVDDFIWKEGVCSFYRLNSVPNPGVEPHCTVMIEDEAP